MMRSPLRYSDHLIFSMFWYISFQNRALRWDIWKLLAFQSRSQLAACSIQCCTSNYNINSKLFLKDLVPSLSSLFLLFCPYSAHACTAYLVLGHFRSLCSSSSVMSIPVPLPIRYSIYSISFWAREWGDPNIEHIEAPFLSVLLLVCLFLSVCLSQFNNFACLWHYFLNGSI